MEELKFQESPELDFLMENGQYHPALAYCVMKLASHHVAVDKINTVIDDVLSLAGKKLANKPSRPIILNMSAARLPVAQQQLTV